MTPGQLLGAGAVGGLLRVLLPAVWGVLVGSALGGWGGQAHLGCPPGKLSARLWGREPGNCFLGPLALGTREQAKEGVAVLPPACGTGTRLWHSPSTGLPKARSGGGGSRESSGPPQKIP